MLLQVALDVVDEEDAIALASVLVREVDRIEVGTPLLLSGGARVIRAIRDLAPEAIIVADCKTMDCGDKLANMVMTNGANGLIVQGAAPSATLRIAAATVEEHGGFMMVDDLGVEDLARLEAKLANLPVAELIVHTGKDEQAEGHTPAERLREASQTVGLPPLAVAGGIDRRNLRSIVAGVNPAVVIVGEAIYRQPDPAHTARELRQLLQLLGTADSKDGTDSQ